MESDTSNTTILDIPATVNAMTIDNNCCNSNDDVEMTDENKPISNNESACNDNENDVITIDSSNDDSSSIIQSQSMSDVDQDSVKHTIPSDSQSVYQPNVYEPPDWALNCPLDKIYKLEVIKNGIVLTDCTVNLTVNNDDDHHDRDHNETDQPGQLSYCLIGRQPKSYHDQSDGGKLYGQCMTLAHPSISRLHAVLQYGQPPAKIAYTDDPEVDTTGWYIQDLNSTHGTFVNKRSLPSGRFVRVRVGYVFRFGGSTRLHILQGPDDDVEQQTTQSWSEIKAAYEARRLKLEEEQLNQRTENQSVDLGCNWGISMDDDDDSTPNVAAFNAAAHLHGETCLTHEKLYRDDPKRALNAYFDREGIEPVPQFEFLEAGFGKQHCRIELPLSSGTVTAEVIVSGKRKEAAVACALEACQLLDRLGEFDQDKGHLTGSKRTRSLAYWEENDYYSSDEDTFMDRTGVIEQKRLDRMRHLGVDNTKQAEAEAMLTAAQSRQLSEPDLVTSHHNATMLAVLSELEKVGEEIVSIEERLSEISRECTAKQSNPSQLDELEAYMRALKSDSSIPVERSKLKARLFKLRQKEMQLFHRAGLPQMRHRLATSTKESKFDDKQQQLATTNNNNFLSTSDAAAAVRAVKQQLEKHTTADSGTAAATTNQTTKSGITNNRANRDALKRSLPSYAKSVLKARSSSSSTTTTTTNTSEEPFEADEDDDDDDDDDEKEKTDVVGDSDGNPDVVLAATDVSNNTGTYDDDDDGQLRCKQSKLNNTTTLKSTPPSVISLSDECDSYSTVVEERRLSPSPPPPPQHLTLNSCTINEVERGFSTDVTEPVKIEMKTPTDDETLDREKIQQEDVSGTAESTATKCVLTTPSSRQKNKKNKHLIQDVDPDYIEWVPPSDQRGDGMTALNLKYGY